MMRPGYNKTMKQVLFGIFAHPDDEAFGPSATLAKEIQNGTELHLICVTDGRNGLNPDKHTDLAKVRMQEWRAAGKLIGATSMHPLDYEDGTLCNNSYHEIADKIEAIVRRDAAAQHGACNIAFMTFDPNGISGHLDHIAVSNITTYVFYKLKEKPPANCTISELAYYCLSREHVPEFLTSYVFMPAGRAADFINRTVDVRNLRDTKYDIMRRHHSQRQDAESILASGDDFHATDHFHVIT